MFLLREGRHPPQYKKRASVDGGDTYCPGDMEFQETITGRLGLREKRGHASSSF